MALLIVFLLLLAAAFGVLGAVIKVAAFLVLTILLTIAALVAVVWYGFKAQLRRWEREGGPRTQVRSWTWGGTSGDGPPELPTHDDRY